MQGEHMLHVLWTFIVNSRAFIVIMWLNNSVTAHKTKDDIMMFCPAISLSPAPKPLRSRFTRVHSLSWNRCQLAFREL